MSNTPFMPLWVADFVGDTLDLDAKELGAYMLILMTMWGRDGYLPNDEKKLQRVARCGRDWPRVWASLSHYFTVDGERITQGRLLLELQKVAAKREVNAQHGALGGIAKALKYKGRVVANASVSPKQPEPEPEPYKKEEDLADKPPPKKRACQLPEGWVPSDKNVSDAEAKGFSETEIENEADRFRDFHTAKGSTFKCWDAAWRTWLGNARKFAGGGMAGQAKSGGYGQGGSIASIAARRRASGQV